jgi:hypothetical protein
MIVIGVGGVGGGVGAGESQEKEENADAGETSSRSLRSSDRKGLVRAAGGDVSRVVGEEFPNPIFKEEYDDDVTRMLSWDAKRKGLALLTNSALNRASKEQQSEPGEILKWRSSFF